MVNQLKAQAKAMIKNKNLPATERNLMLNFLVFLEDFQLSVPTVCCYQFPKTTMGKDAKNLSAKVCQSFLLLSLGLCHRVQDYWTHMFHAGLFQHCTSMPVFVVEERVYFGKCPYVHVVAWGAGNKLSDAQKEVLEKQRRIEKQRMEREKRQFVRNYRMQRELNNQRNAEPPSQTT